jgi:hypothetical protein
VNRCRSCNAPIIWATSVNGKPLPLNVQPEPRGNVELLAVGNGQDPVARVLSSAERAERVGELYVSHWVTCPDAAVWRRR